MAKIKSDIEIARASKIKPISDVLKKYNIPIITVHLVQWDDISQN